MDSDAEPSYHAESAIMVDSYQTSGTTGGSEDVVGTMMTKTTLVLESNNTTV
jgi:hypothetical protein